MKFLFTLLFLAVATIGVAQKKQNVYFFKDDGSYAEIPDSADFVRIVSEPDSGSTLYIINEFYKNEHRKLIGKSSTIIPVKFEGQTASYYENGNRKEINNYKKGMPVGNQFEFYPNGKIYLTKQYADDNDKNHDLVDFEIIANYDSLGNTLAEGGEGHFKFYDSKFKNVILEGDVKAGKKSGKITGEQDGRTFVENFVNGKFIDGVTTDKAGVYITYKDINESLPEFIGGPTEFSKYLGKNISYPLLERERGIQGKAVVIFTVEADGSISNIGVQHPSTKNFDNEAIRVIKKSPKWKPGMQHAAPVRARFTQAISFSLGSR